MKTKLLLLALLICGTTQAQVTMHIHYSDGTVLDIEGTDIDSVYYPIDPMNHAVYLTNDEVQSDPMMLIDSVTFSGVPLVPMSCFDGIQNNGEDYPDCGGPCPPCGTCMDGIQNEVWSPFANDFFMEQGVDCGYPCPSPCAPSCEDGIQNGNETGIDCGGNCPDDCPPPTCFDDVWNGLETGVDCGGPDCPPCPTPSCNDGIQNQNETGIDCGGVCPDECPEPTCFDGIMNGDENGIDCGGNCPVICPPETCNDGVQNQNEEWIDCGGVCPNVCPTCDDGIQNGPEAGNDCVVGDNPDYYDGMCPQCETCFDGMLNQDETAIDCGGIFCAPCEMCLTATSLDGTPFIGSDFIVEMGFGELTFSGSESVGDQTRTLRLKIPLNSEAGDEFDMEEYSFGVPASQYIDTSGDVFESLEIAGQTMVITLHNDAPAFGPKRIEGVIAITEMLNIDPNEPITVSAYNMHFCVNY